MDLSTIYTKTGRGTRAQLKKLPSNAGQILSVMGAKSNGGNIYDQLKKVNPQEFDIAITWLLEGGFIKIVIQEVFSDSVWAPVTQSSISVSEISLDEFNLSVEARERAEAQAKAEAEIREKAEQAAKAQAELEAKQKVEEEAEIKAKLEALAKAEAETRKQAETKAQLEMLARADEEARERAEKQAKAEAEAREKAEQAAQALAELEAKALEEAAALAAAEAEAIQVKEEAASKAKLEALAKAEEEARRRADAQAKAETKAREKAEAKALARAELLAKTEARKQARAEAEAKEKARAEAKAEAVAREKAELLAKEQAELEATQKAEAEAKAAQEEREQAEATAKAEAEAQEKAEVGAKVQAELEAQERAKAIAKAEAKAAARKRKFAEAKAKVEGFKEKIALQVYGYLHRPNKPPISKAPTSQAQTLGQNINVKKIRKQKLAHAFRLATAIFKTSLKYAILLLLVLIVAAQLINLRLFIKPIERIATENIEEAVNVQAVHASLFPAPHLILKNVSAGSVVAVKAETINVFLDLPAWLDSFETPSTTRQINVIEIKNVNISQQNLHMPITWFQTSKNLNRLKINEILLKEIAVDFNQLGIHAIDGDILLKDDGKLDKATLFADNKDLILNIAHENNHYSLDIEAQGWQSPMPPKLVFIKLSAKGTLENDLLTLSSINGTLYEGQFNGNMIVDLSDTWSAKGNIKVESIDLAKMADELKLDTSIDGNFNANGDYSFIYNIATHQIETPFVNARFDVKNGNLKKIDLIEAMRNNHTNIGGTTRFTALSGQLALNNQTYQYKNLTLEDNQLQAYGKVDIAAGGGVSGNIYSKIPLKSNPIKAQLMIAGTIDNLKLRK